MDDIPPRPYVDIQRLVEPSFPPGRLNYWKANFVDELSDELIDILVDAMRRVPSPYTIIAVEQIEGDQRVRDAFGANHERLAQVKRRYDPSNHFRLNQNIEPASDA